MLGRDCQHIACPTAWRVSPLSTLYNLLLLHCPCSDLSHCASTCHRPVAPCRPVQHINMGWLFGLSLGGVMCRRGCLGRGGISPTSRANCPDSSPQSQSVRSARSASRCFTCFALFRFVRRRSALFRAVSLCFILFRVSSPSLTLFRAPGLCFYSLSALCCVVLFCIVMFRFVSLDLPLFRYASLARTF